MSMWNGSGDPSAAEPIGANGAGAGFDGPDLGSFNLDFVVNAGASAAGGSVLNTPPLHQSTQQSPGYRPS